jgi:hypothetical protein
LFPPTEVDSDIIADKKSRKRAIGVNVNASGRLELLVDIGIGASVLASRVIGKSLALRDLFRIACSISRIITSRRSEWIRANGESPCTLPPYASLSFEPKNAARIGHRAANSNICRNSGDESFTRFTGKSRNVRVGLTISCSTLRGNMPHA